VASDGLAYRAALRTLGRARQWAKALELLEAMPGRWGNAPDSGHYTEALHACAAAGEWREALRLHAVLRRPAATASSGTASGGGGGGGGGGAAATAAPLATTATFNGALRACAMVGRWEEALQLLREMDTRPPQPPQSPVSPESAESTTATTMTKRSTTTTTTTTTAAAIRSAPEEHRAAEAHGAPGAPTVLCFNCGEVRVGLLYSFVLSMLPTAAVARHVDFHL